MNQAGFTLTETILVVVLLGVLGVAAVGRLDVAPLAERGYFDELLNALRYGQKLAVASRCDVQVTISAGGYALHRRDGCKSGAFGTAVVDPGDRAGAFAGSAPAGVAATPATLRFDALGRASPGATVTVTGAQTRSIVVVAETGYAYQGP